MLISARVGDREHRDEAEDLSTGKFGAPGLHHLEKRRLAFGQAARGATSVIAEIDTST